MEILDITLRQFLWYVLYALPGVMLWYAIFRFQNSKALPAEVVRDTFFIGLFSVIPLLLYDYAQNTYTKFLPSINTFYLSNILQAEGVFGSIGQIIIAFLVLGVFFALVSGGFTIFYSFFSKESVKNTFKALLSEPLNMGAMGIIFFALLIVDIILRTFTPFEIPQGILGKTFILAILEEYSKHLIVRFFDDHKIKSIANAIELSMIVALSFAFLENIIYIVRHLNDSKTTIEGIAFGRSIVSMFGHVIYSTIFGYYYGLSKFASSVMVVHQAEKHVPAFPAWVYKIFRFKTANTYKAQKIFEGLVLASLVHTIFNLCIELQFIPGVILVLMAGGYLMYLILLSDMSQRELALVGSKEMPEADFEKLVWKISVMKHLKEIKKLHPDKE